MKDQVLNSTLAALKSVRPVDAKTTDVGSKLRKHTRNAQMRAHHESQQTEGRATFFPGVLHRFNSTADRPEELASDVGNPRQHTPNPHEVHIFLRRRVTSGSVNDLAYCHPHTTVVPSSSERSSSPKELSRSSRLSRRTTKYCEIPSAE